MALYQYKCSSCGHEQEVSHRMTETPEIKCEKCNNECKKVICASSFNLKGGGWHSGGFSAKK